MVRKMMLLNRASTMTVAALVVGVMGLASLPSAHAKGEKGGKNSSEDLSRIRGISAADLQAASHAQAAAAAPATPSMSGTSAACNTARATLERRNAEIRSCMDNGPTRSGSPEYQFLNACSGPNNGIATIEYCRNTVRTSVPTSFAELSGGSWLTTCRDTVVQQQKRYCGISNNGSEDSAVRALHVQYNREAIGCIAAGVSENSVCTTVSRDSAAPLARMQEIRSQVAPLDSVLTNSSSLITRTNTEVADLNQQIINARNQIVNLESFIRARQNTINEATANVAAARTSRTTLTTEFSQRKADYDRLLARLNGVNCGSVAYPAAAPLPAMPAIAGH